MNFIQKIKENFLSGERFACKVENSVFFSVSNARWWNSERWPWHLFARLLNVVHWLLGNGRGWLVSVGHLAALDRDRLRVGTWRQLHWNLGELTNRVTKVKTWHETHLSRSGCSDLIQWLRPARPWRLSLSWDFCAGQSSCHRLWLKANKNGIRRNFLRR